MEHEGTATVVGDHVTDEELAERVALGVYLLDQRMPDWWQEDRESPINLTTLALWSARNCVLGQLGGYWTLRVRLGLTSLARVEDRTTSHGFSLSEAEFARDGGAAYDRLTALWTAEILRRRQAAMTA